MQNTHLANEWKIYFFYITIKHCYGFQQNYDITLGSFKYKVKFSYNAYYLYRSNLKCCLYRILVYSWFNLDNHTLYYYLSQYNNQTWSRLWDGTIPLDDSHFPVRNKACQVYDEEKCEHEAGIVSCYVITITDYISHTIRPKIKCACPTLKWLPLELIFFS